MLLQGVVPALKAPYTGAGTCSCDGYADRGQQHDSPEPQGDDPMAANSRDRKKKKKKEQMDPELDKRSDRSGIIGKYDTVVREDMEWRRGPRQFGQKQ